MTVGGSGGWGLGRCGRVQEGLQDGQARGAALLWVELDRADLEGGQMEKDVGTRVCLAVRLITKRQECIVAGMVHKARRMARPVAPLFSG